jgi:hypothetical protein
MIVIGSDPGQDEKSLSGKFERLRIEGLRYQRAVAFKQQVFITFGPRA